MCVGGAASSDLQPAVPLARSAADWPCLLCVPGNSAVWPPAQRAAETVSAALSVLQSPAPHQSPLPIAHLGLLQQLSQQSHPAAGDDLRAAVHVHTGKQENVVLDFTCPP